MQSALIALRTRLSTDPNLVAFFESHYGKTIKHVFGYKKAFKADDYPILSYVRPKAKYALNGTDNGLAVSLVLGLHDADVLDENGDVLTNDLVGNAQFLEFAGANRLTEAVELIIASLLSHPLIGDFYLMSDFQVFDEIPPATPFFNAEITFVLKHRDSRDLNSKL